MAEQPPVGQDLLIIEVKRSHSDTPRSVGLLQTVTSPSQRFWQHTTPTKDRSPCPRRDLNTQCQ